MPTTLVEYAGVEVEVDEQGYMVDAAQWTPEIAEAIADEVGLPSLTEKHWQVITFCREDAAREGAAPQLRRISKLSGVPMKELYALFPKGPGRLAALVSGLPKPKGCI